MRNYEKYWGRPPEDHQQVMDSERLHELWSLYYGPSARAHLLLESIDLGPSLSGPNAVGGIDLITEYNHAGWQWRVARLRDEVSLSLLQQRLNDLGTGIHVLADSSDLFWDFALI